MPWAYFWDSHQTFLRRYLGQTRKFEMVEIRPQYNPLTIIACDFTSVGNDLTWHQLTMNLESISWVDFHQLFLWAYFKHQIQESHKKIFLHSSGRKLPLHLVTWPKYHHQQSSGENEGFPGWFLMRLEVSWLGPKSFSSTAAHPCSSAWPNNR